MSESLSALADLAREHAKILIPLGLIPAVLLLLLSSQSQNGEPRSVKEAIPYFSNAYQYMTDLQSFMKRVGQQIGVADILKMNIGPARIYLAKGGKNVEAMFRKSSSLNSDRFIMMAFKHLESFSKEDLKKFSTDKSGRLATPAPGSENLPAEKRLWMKMHEVHHQSLLRKEPSAYLAKVYDRFFSAALDQQPLGEWATVRVYDFLKRDMGKSACMTMSGERCLQAEPTYLDKFWEFDTIAFQVVFGPPRWLRPTPIRIRDEWNRLNQRVLKGSLDSFDWEGEAADSEWEPTFGSRCTRDLVKLGVDNDFSLQTMAGIYGGGVFGTNSNAVPTVAWIMYEVIRRPDLYQAVREEAQAAAYTDPDTGKPAFNIDQLLSQPLLQSIYVEALRLNVCVSITREVVEDTELSGYKLKKGALIQAPTNLAHYDNQIWGRDGHDASEFWPERHIKEVEKVDEATGKVSKVKEFSLAARPSEFFPYGGGVSMCAGRFFVKREILLTIAMLTTRFDMEFVEWVDMDGKKSERGPLQDQKYFGAAAVPPDRDMKIRWKKLW